MTAKVSSKGVGKLVDRPGSYCIDCLEAHPKLMPELGPQGIAMLRADEALRG